MREQIDLIVEKDGKLPKMETEKIRDIIRSRAGRFLRIILTNEKKRSIEQNSWFHVVNKMIADFLRQQSKEQGNEKYYEINEETTKLWIKQKFLGYEEIEGERYLRKTRNLKTFEMNQLWEDLQLYFAPKGLNIPDPNQSEFVKDKIKTEKFNERR